jgi:hypothetical protein
MKILISILIALVSTSALGIETPLSQKTITLLLQKNRKTASSIDLNCLEFSNLPQKKCIKYQLSISEDRSNHQQLGRPFPNDKLESLLNYYLNNFSTRPGIEEGQAVFQYLYVTGYLMFNPRIPHILGPLALIGGLSADIIKAPFVPFAQLGQFIYLKNKRRRLKKQFAKLLKNKKYKAVNVRPRLYLEYMTGVTINWLKKNNL